MRPVLLPRSNIDSKKAEERRQTLQEGHRLAEYLDSLREMKANEEKAFEEYRKGVTNDVQDEISSLHRQKEALEEEMKQKKAAWAAQLQEMYGPLDKQWMRYVKEEKARIEKELAEQQLIRSDLEEKRKINTLLHDSLQKEREDVRILSSKASEELGKASQAKKEGERLRKDAKKEAERILVLAKEKDEETEKRAYSVAMQEESLAVRQAELKKFSDSIEEREWKVIAKELQFYSPVKKL
ncbi:MAG: hypothetical protein KGJ90_02125 [Patescibacteria group bacterium]|nr:hypothetical protein [Patescibacteria group bacterium]